MLPFSRRGSSRTGVIIGVLALASACFFVLFDSDSQESIGPGEHRRAAETGRLDSSELVKMDSSHRSAALSKITFSVRSKATREAVEGASVRLADREDAVFASDSEGRVVVQAVEGLQVRVHSPGFLDWSGSVEDGAIVYLVPGRSVYGRLVPPSEGPSDLSGVKVLIWNGPTPGPETVLSAVAKGQHDGVYATSCSKDGAFQVMLKEGPEPLFLAAGGEGLASPHPGGIQIEPDMELSVPLYWLHGVEVSFERGPNSPVRLSHRASSPSSLVIRQGTEPVRAHGMRTPQMVLNGLILEPPAMMVSDQRWYFGLAERPLTRDQWPWLAGRYMGYEELLVPLEMQPVTHGLVRQSVSLLPTSSEYADLRVRFGHRLRGLLEASAQAGQFATFHLKCKDSRSSGYFLIADDHLEELLIPDVPVGPISGRLDFLGGQSIALEAAESGSSLAVESTGTEVDMDCSFLAWVEISLKKRGGGSYTGPATFSVGRLNGDFERQSHMVAFAGPPYRVPILRPGKYAGALTIPAVTDLLLGHQTQFVIDQESVYSVTATIDPP